MPSVVDIVGTSLPLPDSVARRLSTFHRVMRWRCIGFVVFAIITLVLSVQPMVAVAPVLLLITWLGVVDAGVMQRFFDYASGWFIAILVLSIEVIFGIHSRTFGYQEKFKQRSLFLMNHVCHFDWLFFWGVVERSGDTTCWKAIAKDMIKKVPLVGVCMQYACHIFVTRRWEDDEKEFKKKLFYYNAVDLPVQLLLFPEGGDLTSRSKAKSDSYADTNGLQRYEYCLHPRARGFLYIMEALRSGRLDAVYDVTVGYPDALAKTEADFARGDCIPREIHYNVQHYKAEDLPTDEQELTQWLSDRWKEKEKTLELFYTHKQFMEPVPRQADSNEATPQQNGHSKYRPVQEVLRPKSYIFILCGMAFYSTLMVVFSYFFLLSWVWRCCVLVMTIFTFTKGLIYTGIDVVLPDSICDRIEAAYHKCHRREN